MDFSLFVLAVQFTTIPNPQPEPERKDVALPIVIDWENIFDLIEIVCLVQWTSKCHTKNFLQTKSKWYYALLEGKNSSHCLFHRIFSSKKRKMDIFCNENFHVLDCGWQGTIWKIDITTWWNKISCQSRTRNSWMLSGTPTER